MRIEYTDVIQSDSEKVYQLVRDDLSKLADYLPHIKKIDQEYQKKIRPNTYNIVNRWYANIELPYLLRKFVSEDLFSWKDTAIWCDKKKCVQYELESFYANNLFSAQGSNYFLPFNESQTQLKVECEFQIYPEKVPGVPKIMSKKIVPMIDQLVEKAFAPNMKSLGFAIKKYLNEN